MGVRVARAGVGVRAGRDASGQFHRAIVLQKFASPSPDGDKDEATWQPPSKPGRVLINAQIVGPLRESGKHAFIQCLTAFDPQRSFDGRRACWIADIRDRTCAAPKSINSARVIELFRCTLTAVARRLDFE